MKRLPILFFLLITSNLYCQSYDFALKQNIYNFYINPYTNFSISSAEKLQYESLDELYGFFGNPNSLDTQDVSNLYNTDQIDTLYILNYEFFEIKIYHVANTSKYYYISTTFYNSDYTLKYNLYFGMSKEELFSIVGTPRNEFPDLNGCIILEYPSDDFLYVLHFTIDNDQLTNFYFVVAQ